MKQIETLYVLIDRMCFFIRLGKNLMKNDQDPYANDDSKADAIAAVAVLVIVVTAVVYWLSQF